MKYCICPIKIQQKNENNYTNVAENLPPILPRKQKNNSKKFTQIPQQTPVIELILTRNKKQHTTKKFKSNSGLAAKPNCFSF